MIFPEIQKVRIVLVLVNAGEGEGKESAQLRQNV